MSLTLTSWEFRKKSSKSHQQDRRESRGERNIELIREGIIYLRLGDGWDNHIPYHFNGFKFQGKDTKLSPRNFSLLPLVVCMYVFLD
jgi:hypothetical protein